MHHILAGAVILIMHSRFGPCGLEQLYALRYGAVPVVRATGGLDDTVIDNISKPGQGTGYKFDEFSPEAFLDVLARAVADFDHKDIWCGIVRRAINQNFSWDMAAVAYEDVY